MDVRKLSLALTASAVLVALLSCARRGGEPFETVSVEEVERMLRDPEVVLVDANTPEIFRRNHLPGARHGTYGSIAQVLPAEKDRRVVFYCASPS